MSRYLLMTVVLATSAWPCSADEFQSRFAADRSRTWIGPEYYAARLQDWRLHDGRAGCIEAGEDNPLRVLHLLAADVNTTPGTLCMRVRTGPIEPECERTADAWAGFLIGAGGEDVDYRLTALVHHRPAKDGGLLVVVAGDGRVAFRDNETNVNAGNLWGIAGKLGPGELAELPASMREDTDPVGPAPEAFDLLLTVEPAGNKYRLTAEANNAATGALLSRAVLKNVDARLVDGGVGLVSHRGSSDGKHGFWFRDWRISGSKLARHPERTFGPVACTQYTLSHGTLKLTAQMMPLGTKDAQSAQLQMKAGDGGEWKTVATGDLVADSFTIPFRVDGYEARRPTSFRVAYSLRAGDPRSRTHYWTGTIRAEPCDEDEFVLAAFTGNKHFTGGLEWNHSRVWFPHNDLVAAVTHHNPDFLFFSGDQVYEGDLTRPQRQPLDKAMLDYLDRWYRWCWTFRELTRDRPCVAIPDDHDVYHGNIWGSGGRAAKRPDDGGYCMPPRFVNTVQRTQTSHLPDPVDPAPVEQGISVYFTAVDYGGVSFAVIEDRKFKSSPTELVPAGEVVNGWFQAPGFDPATQADVPGAVLLGERQLRFLEEWAVDLRGNTWMKVVLSQTVFANVATLPADARSDAVVPGLKVFASDDYPLNDRAVADADSNGWPQAGRNRALRAIRRGFALHVAGDQHLGSLVHYGVDEWEDAGFGFCVPSIANAWPRRWFPPEVGENHIAGQPRYTGRYRDGFGNRMTVHAVSNPRQLAAEPTRLTNCAPGYGIVRFHRAPREIVIECWPRWEKPAEAAARQYPGWPVRVAQVDNYDRAPTGYLPEIVVTGLREPVIRIIREADGEVVYARRAPGSRVRPFVFEAGTYTLEVGDPDHGRWKKITSLKPALQSTESISIAF